jgi:hypothetical protein
MFDRFRQDLPNRIHFEADEIRCKIDDFSERLFSFRVRVRVVSRLPVEIRAGSFTSPHAFWCKCAASHCKHFSKSYSPRETRGIPSWITIR